MPKDPTSAKGWSRVCSTFACLAVPARSLTTRPRESEALLQQERLMNANRPFPCCSNVFPILQSTHNPLPEHAKYQMVRVIRRFDVTP